MDKPPNVGVYRLTESLGVCFDFVLLAFGDGEDMSKKQKKPKADKGKTAILIADLIIKAVVAAAALIEAIK